MTAGRDAQPAIVLADPAARQRNEARARMALLTRLIGDELRGLAARQPAERGRRRTWILVAQARRRAWFETLQAMKEAEPEAPPARRRAAIEIKSRPPIPPTDRARPRVQQAEQAGAAVLSSRI